jgi:hypothetical protein
MSTDDPFELESAPEEAYGQEGTTDPEDAYGVEEEAIADPGYEDYPMEADDEQAEGRTPLIAGGVLVAVLIAITCCLLTVLAIVFFRNSSGGGEPVPTLPPLVLPTNTPAAPDEPTPTPTPGDEPQPTPTTPVSPEAVINAPAQATQGERVAFDGSQSVAGTSRIARYDWDFGDGNTGSGERVRYVYQAPGNYTVTLTVTDQDGLTDTAPAQIEILSAATAEPTATPEPTGTPEPTPTPIAAPVIDDFEVEPEAIKVGQCVEVSWSASGGTFWVNILRNDDYIWENAPIEGTLQDCPDKAGDYRYRVVAWNEEDDRVREDVNVTVTE